MKSAVGALANLNPARGGAGPPIVVGLPTLRSKDPEGVAQEMWALFAVYQALCQLIGA